METGTSMNGYLLTPFSDNTVPALHMPLAAITTQGSPLCLQAREFEEYLKCGHLEYGFLRVRCESCHAEQLVAFSCKRRGYAK